MDVAVVVRFSFPKLMAPDESVIDPLASVRLPIVEPVALAMVPVVVMFSLPKLIAPTESVIDPLATVSVLFIAKDVPVVVKFSCQADCTESLYDPLANVVTQCDRSP